MQILKDNLKQSAEKLGMGENFHFQQDNDPKHTTSIVKEWIIYNVPHVLETSPQSPDINPIEHLWVEIGRQLSKYNINSKEVLKTKIFEVWNNIKEDITENLIDSMQRRWQAIINAHSDPTKY